MAKRGQQPEIKKAELEQHEGLDALSKSLKVSFIWLYVLVVIMIGAIVMQSFFIVKQHEIGFVYRFGQLRGIVGTGLHLVWPYPIEETQAVDLRRSKQVESDSFMFKQSGDVNARISPVLKPGVDGFLLTGDRNIIHAKCLLTYYVDSSNRDSIMNYFIYNAPDQQKILKAILDNAVIKAASMTSAEDILFKTDKFRGQLAKILRKELKEASLGVTFESKDISIKATSPRQTKSAFDAMSQASQQQDTMKSKAEAFRISAEKQARGEADSIISTARSEQIRKVAAAKSDASTFTQRLKQYRKTPDLISRTIYEETMFRIFQNVDEKFVIRQDSKGQIRLLISRSMDKNKKKKK